LGRGGTGGIFDDDFLSPLTRPVELLVEKVDGVEPDLSLRLDTLGCLSTEEEEVEVGAAAIVFERSTPLSRFRGPSAVFKGRW
jgi:hypothetical protein